MNGAGNRFAVFDAREAAGFVLSEDKVKAICKPASSVMGPKGADQLIVKICRRRCFHGNLEPEGF